MKHTAIILLFLIGSCAPKNLVIVSSANMYLLDFSEFSEKGFLITPETYSGNYESKGLVEYEFMNSATCETLRNEGTGMSYRNWVPGKFYYNNGLQEVYEQVLNLGGDALINFRIEYFEVTGTSQDCQQNTYFPGGYAIRGFAIKRVE